MKRPLVAVVSCYVIGLLLAAFVQPPLATLFHERLFVIHKPEVRGLRTSLVPPPVRYNEVWIES